MLARFVPAARWMRDYDRADLHGDVTAGVTTAVMLVPQGMAYAMLAGLPPIVGLYASIAPLVVYALLGTSRQLAVGPVAMDSLMVAAAVGAMAPAGSDHAVALALVLAAMVGTIQLVMGLMRLGFLVTLLSHPVISGFTSAAAVIIGVSQLQHLLGFPMARSRHVHVLLFDAVTQLGRTHAPTLLLGGFGIALMLGLRRWAPKVPAAIVTVAATTLAVLAFELDAAGVAVIGSVPAGLPDWTVPVVSWAEAQALVPSAFAIAIVAFTEAISVGKAFATRNRYRLDASQELVAIGAANLAGSLTGGYPITGGFSRTAVNASAGARTPLAGMITAALVAVVLVLFTPVFRLLPKATLAGIVMVAVFGLIDVATLRHLWRTRRSDAAALLVTFAATLLLGIDSGIATGVVFSLALFVLRAARPHMAELGAKPDGATWRNVCRHEDAAACRDVAVLRVDTSLFFANIDAVVGRINALVHERGDAARAVVLDCSAVNDIDSSAARTLVESAGDLARAGVELHLARVKGPVRDGLEAAGIIGTLGAERCHEDVAAAMAALAAAPRPAYTTETAPRLPRANEAARALRQQHAHA